MFSILLKYFHSNHIDLDKASMNLDEMLKYRVVIIKNLDEVGTDLNLLRNDDELCARNIDDLNR